MDEVGIRRFEQEGREGFGDEGGADDVGGEGGFELLFQGGRLGVDARVVDQDVQAAVLAFDLLDRGGY